MHKLIFKHASPSCEEILVCTLRCSLNFSILLCTFVWPLFCNTYNLVINIGTFFKILALNFEGCPKSTSVILKPPFCLCTLLTHRVESPQRDSFRVCLLLDIGRQTFFLFQSKQLFRRIFQYLLDAVCLLFCSLYSI